MRASGIDCTGPLPSDTIFLRARAGHFDAVVMMYHDQGQIAIKLLGFQKGVTVSAGMKTVYATPAHGTAFDIVGQGPRRSGRHDGGFRHGCEARCREEERMKALATVFIGILSAGILSMGTAFSAEPYPSGRSA